MRALNVTYVIATEVCGNQGRHNQHGYEHQDACTRIHHFDCLLLLELMQSIIFVAREK
jgi:hypothetical protein